MDPSGDKRERGVQIQWNQGDPNKRDTLFLQRAGFHHLVGDIKLRMGDKKKNFCFFQNQKLENQLKFEEGDENGEENIDKNWKRQKNEEKILSQTLKEYNYNYDYLQIAKKLHPYFPKHPNKGVTTEIK
eukprot:TRINITY_DN2490_c0_g1_i2.p1 TRINITY_DN2490_c0_g1~~TRINITY_DN2490_c0_g1_i2.p1  ORF type:complete len:129 (-),score=33.21 TRINITY_DN2490_c0_g1_i2:71-457(-)